MNNEEEKTEEVTEEKVPSIVESMLQIVDIMNSGKVNPKDVYPSGNRYHGD